MSFLRQIGYSMSIIKQIALISGVISLFTLPSISQAMLNAQTNSTKTLTSSTQMPFSPYADFTINAHWDSKYQDMEPMDLVEVSRLSGVSSYHLAFITDAGSCTPAWGGQSSYSTDSGWGSHLTDSLNNNKINYTISFGGASGNDISLACTDSQLVSAYEQVITTYHPQGLDFDIENGTANVSKIMTALGTIQKNHPDLKLSFTLPVLPEGLTSSGQDVVTQAVNQQLNFAINIMAMDFGPAYTSDMGGYATQAATNLFEFIRSLYPTKTDADIWQMVEVTPMIGVNDVSTEQFSFTDVDTLKKFAAEKHIGSLSMWSIARDNPCADKWASAICSGNNLQTKPYEFAMQFLKDSN